MKAKGKSIRTFDLTGLTHDEVNDLIGALGSATRPTMSVDAQKRCRDMRQIIIDMMEDEEEDED